MRQWVLVVEFDPIDVQEARDPENAFPRDDMSRFVHYLGEHWDLEPEDFKNPDLCVWDGDRITLYPEVLDQAAGPIEWLLMHSIPTRLELTR